MSGAMTDSLHPSSQSAPPMDDDDLLTEILLRLPPQPSSLPRASLVCKRWRRLLSDVAFHARFRIHHRSSPPLLGFFKSYSCSFQPILVAPDRVPPEHFSLQLSGPSFLLLGCRHGLVLILDLRRHQLLVWDPVTADQRRIAVPEEFDATKNAINGEVLFPTGDIQHFQVVLVVAHKDHKQHRRVVACVYSSDTDMWGDRISIPLPSKDHYLHIMPFTSKPAVLVGNSLYWMLAGNQNPVGILEFDLERQRLAMIEVPVDIFAKKSCQLWVMRAEGGGIGFLFVSESDFRIQLWKRMTDCAGIASWVLGRTIEIDKVLTLNSEEKGNLIMLGLAENNNVVFLWTIIGVFMVQLDTLQYKKVFNTNISNCRPFESVYTTGGVIGGRRHSSELLHNT
ncbi:unnamed protein product [Alopecurus aequalis]